MFSSAVKYEILQNLRSKQLLIWLILFPVIMGTIYKFVFSGIYDKSAFSAVDTAVVENKKDPIFHIIMDAMDKAENKVLNVTYCDEEEAYKLLHAGDVKGVLFIDPPSDEEPALTEEVNAGIMDSMKKYMLDSGYLDKYLDEGSINGLLSSLGDKITGNSTDSEWMGFFSSFNIDYLAQFIELYEGGDIIPKTELSLKVKRSGMEQTTLKKMAEMYQNMQGTGRELLNMGLSGELGNASKLAKTMEMNTAVVKEVPLTEGNTDPYASYMYNLIALVSVFASLSGLEVAIKHEANLSVIGARRTCSGTPKFKAMLASLVGYYICGIICVFISISFITFILRVDFGSRLLLVYLAGIFGGILGVSMGFFFGSIGKLSAGAKSGILMALNMTFCFMSGAMLPGIKALFEINAPIVNDLNPAAVISDSLYYLSVDEDLSRYFGKILAMTLFTAVFVLLGFILTRRRQYASL